MIQASFPHLTYKVISHFGPPFLSSVHSLLLNIYPKFWTGILVLAGASAAYCTTQCGRTGITTVGNSSLRIRSGVSGLTGWALTLMVELSVLENRNWGTQNPGNIDTLFTPPTLELHSHLCSIGSGPQLISFQDLNEKWPFSKPTGEKTERSTHINYTSLERNTLRTTLAEFSDRGVRFVFP